MTAQLSDGMGGAFAMLPLEPDGPLLAALRDGELYSRDLAVLWALVARLDWHSGRAWVSRQDLAQAIGQPRAARAVGSAVAANAIGYLIPCHRVIRGSGDTGQYRWGPQRKQAMLGWEAARATGQSEPVAL